jgi:hypothetical protein
MSFDKMSQEKEVRRVLDLLETVVRTSGSPRAELDHRLGQSVGYLSRIFGEKIDLKARHIYEILALVGMDPADFYHLAYPRRAGGGAVAGGGGGVPFELIESFQRLGYRVTPAEPALQLTPEQLDRRIQDAVRQALAEGGGTGEASTAKKVKKKPGRSRPRARKPKA